MIFDSDNLAENKLLVLYVLDQMKLPLSSGQINQIVLENSSINYFALQQYIDDLFQSKLVSKNHSQGKSYYSLTKQGKEILELFFKRLPENWCKEVNQYISEHRNSVLNESRLIASYTKKGDEEFWVQLKILENESVLMDLSISVASNQQAKDIVNNWKRHGEKIYGPIIQSLIKDYSK
ncbi:DUF4364 family protein [Irregularibacter muris]|uniref:DUF4364 family protein n=1 Tax=Irregularibacter muris TaxID=1796619 RepID=A0AAE3HK73_9FIRM|nr:DUF4364 family protein [Irregularibacter muris]MCR1900289.1 DUF4364 family protein [Irregularibacter muris]